MSLLYIIIILILIGLALYLIEFIPMDAAIKKIIRIVVIVFTIIWLLKVVGFWGYMLNIKV